MKKLFLFPVNWILARTIRFFLMVFGSQKKIDVAFISNFRDLCDVSKFGYWNIDQAPDVLSWVRYRWEGLNGRLFMIGSLTENIGGDKATKVTIRKARIQFLAAVEKAAALGAHTVLLAAATKRLFKSGELSEYFPEVTFTLGDNFTGLLLGERIAEAFRLSRISSKRSRVLLIAPYGLLGGVSLQYLLGSKCELVCMGNPKRKELLEGLAQRYGFKTAYRFEDVGRVDMVVACNSSAAVQLNKERVGMIGRVGKKLIVIDPNEPQNMTPLAFKDCLGKVIRYDAGNGYSHRLRYILGGIASGILRLPDRVTWGCFCETFIIAKHPQIKSVDWFDISPRNIKLMYKFYGAKEGQFNLPLPTCHTKPLKDFSLEEKSKARELARLFFRQLEWSEGFKMLF